MKLITALEIAEDCGLSTVGEAILNIRMRAVNLFNCGEEVSECKELWWDFKISGLDLDTKICDIDLKGLSRG